MNERWRRELSRSRLLERAARGLAGASALPIIGCIRP